MNSKKKILFLYTELASYFLSCIARLAKNREVEIYIVHYPVNQEAPFEFSMISNVKLLDRKRMNNDEFENIVDNISPDAIFCSGWVDKLYLNICRNYFNKIPTILALDNQWKGTIRQFAAIIFSRFFLLNKFSHIWVSGEPQARYARKLGFPNQNIFSGFYSAYFNFFYKQYLENKKIKSQHFPRKFIYVARYYQFKGILDLWQAFIELQNENPNEWELWCFGKGDITPIQHPKIKHFGFVQPDEMKKYISQTGVFILPSHFEPWGVALHEFAAAGFPVICSDEVGAATEFLEDGKNGFIFPAKNINSLKSSMKQMMNLTDAQLNKMGEISVELARKITPEIWAGTLWKIMKEKKSN